MAVGYYEPYDAVYSVEAFAIQRSSNGLVLDDKAGCQSDLISKLLACARS